MTARLRGPSWRPCWSIRHELGDRRSEAECRVALECSITQQTRSPLPSGDVDRSAGSCARQWLATVVGQLVGADAAMFWLPPSRPGYAARPVRSRLTSWVSPREASRRSGIVLPSRDTRRPFAPS